MDNDDFRRGKPTNHKVYGEDVAVLAGDGLLTAAFSFIAGAELSADVRIKAVNVLADCAGYIGMVGGQILDMEAESRQCTAEDVIEIQSRKTGALIRAACQLGVIAASGSEGQLHAAGTFADHLGLAFQIRDDMLDVIGTVEQMGKTVGTDVTKNTFVQLYGLEKCDDLVKEHTDLAIDALIAFEEAYFLTDLAEYLTDRFV
jgi:geranylgeranyl diphosphate synthase type II